MSPTHGRYIQAFKKQAPKYEFEYLDSTESSTALLAFSNSKNNLAMAAAQRQTLQSQKMTAEEEKMVSSFAAMADQISGWASKMAADNLKSDLDKGLFSTEGKRRAEALLKTMLDDATKAQKK